MQPPSNTSLRAYTVMLALAAVLLAFVVLNRWVLTDLGMVSFGRVWQLYISYGDAGFVKRGLIGTLFTETGLNTLFHNEYWVAIVSHHVAIILLTVLVAGFIVRNRIADRLLIASVLLSPALIIQLGYTTGALDVYVLIFASLNLFYVRNLSIFSLILVLGTLTHELFVVTIPAQFVALAVRTNLDLRVWRSFVPLLLPAVVTVVALLLVFYAGQVNIGHDAFERLMLEKLPHAAHQHSLWSGYFEVSNGVADNAQSFAVIVQQLQDYWLYMVLPLLYVGLVTFRAMQAASNRMLQWLVLFASLIPLATYGVATDVYRWVGMSANMALALTLVLGARQPQKLASAWLGRAIVLFVVLAPFGSTTMYRPFPMHQFVLEKWY